MSAKKIKGKTANIYENFHFLFHFSRCERVFRAHSHRASEEAKVKRIYLSQKMFNFAFDFIFQISLDVNIFSHYQEDQCIITCRAKAEANAKKIERHDKNHKKTSLLHDVNDS